MNENQQLGKPYPVRRLRNYGAGALVVLFIFLGVAMVVYTLNMFPFSWVHLLTWIFAPLGVFTCLFTVFAGRDLFYFLVYGIIMVLIGLLPVASPFVAPMVLIGVVIIVLAVIGIIAYWRKR